MRYWVHGNYGNNTIALLQWMHQSGVVDVTVVHVETGWADPAWETQVASGQALARAYGFSVVAVSAQPDFTDSVMDRGRFPTRQFNWCALFLKGLSFLRWADAQDPDAQATVVLSARGADSRLRTDLVEHVAESAHYGGRALWYPLYAHSDAERNALIQKAGVSVLPNGLSLECQPCIHSSVHAVARLPAGVVDRVAGVEEQSGTFFFPAGDMGGAQGIRAVVEWAKAQAAPAPQHPLESFDAGCGAPFACGE